MRKIFLCLLIVCITVVCCSCQNLFTYDWKPCNQPVTSWKSEDGSIEFSVPEEGGRAPGRMLVGGDTVEFYMTNDMGNGMHLRPLECMKKEVITQDDTFEYWTCSFRGAKKFVATVEKTTYFKVGDKITFYRVDK